MAVQLTAKHEKWQLEGIGFLSKAKKGKDEDGQDIATIQLLFSSDAEDYEKEIVEQEGVNKALSEHFQQMGSQLDWEHQYKVTKNPKWIIGKLNNFKKVKFKDEKGRLLNGHSGEGELWLGKKALAKDVYEHLEAGGYVGASLEGGYLKKKGKRVKDVIITRISLTTNPVNSTTRVNLYKAFMDDNGDNNSVINPNEILKSLTASSAGALIPEDLEGNAFNNNAIDKIRTEIEFLSNEGYGKTEIMESITQKFNVNFMEDNDMSDELEKSMDEINAKIGKSDEETEDEKSALEKGLDLVKKGMEFIKGNASENEDMMEDTEVEDEEDDEDVSIENVDKANLVKFASTLNKGDAKKVKGMDKASLIKYCKANASAKELNSFLDGMNKSFNEEEFFMEEMEDMEKSIPNSEQFIVDKDEVLDFSKDMAELKKSNEILKKSQAHLLKAVGFIIDNFGDMQKAINTVSDSLEKGKNIRGFHANGIADVNIDASKVNGENASTDNEGITYAMAKSAVLNDIITESEYKKVKRAFNTGENLEKSLIDKIKGGGE